MNQRTLCWIFYLSISTSTPYIEPMWSIIFLSFWSGYRDQIACSLLGGFSKPRTVATQSLSSVPNYDYMLCSTYGSGPPSLPPLRFPRPNSMSPDNFPTRASLSPPLASSPSVFRLFAVSPVAPVVTRRPPVRLTGGRCHAAPGFLASVPIFGGEEHTW